MGGMGVTPRRAALLAVGFGQLLVVVGITILFSSEFGGVVGVAVGLITAGALIVIDALVLVDIDKTSRG